MKFTSPVKPYSLIVFFVLFLSVLSCSKYSQDTTVKIGLIPWPGYEPLILAESKNLFMKNDIKVEIKRFKSTVDTIQGVRDGVVQGAALTLDEAILLNQSGSLLKVVLVLDYSMGGDMLIGQKDIKSFQELKGKKIGCEKSVLGEFFLHRALESNNLKERDVEIIEVGAENWISAFKENSIDALVCFNPVATTLLNYEEGNLLFSSRDIPFEIIDVLVFSESFFSENKAAVIKIVKTWFDALEYMDRHFDEAVEIMALEEKITPAEFKQGLKGIVIPDVNINKAVFDSKSENNIYKYSQVVIDFMLSKSFISRRVNTDDFFEPSILNELGEK